MRGVQGPNKCDPAYYTGDIAPLFVTSSLAESALILETFVLMIQAVQLRSIGLSFWRSWYPVNGVSHGRASQNCGFLTRQEPALRTVVKYIGVYAV
jgi:hypothetical protein